MAELQFEGIRNIPFSFSRLPEIMNEETNKITIVDTNYFESGTRNPIDEIIEASAMHSLLNENHKEIKLKILLIIRCSCIKTSSHDRPIHDLFAILDKMFPNLTESEKKAIGIVFTCEYHGRNKEYYLMQLKKRVMQPTDKWIYYFKSHPEQVFLVPEASDEMLGQIFTFDDKERLIDFVGKDHLINPTAEIVVNNEANLYLEDSVRYYFADFLNEVEIIVNKITDIYQTINNVDELNKWSECIQNISKIEINNPSDFKNAIENNLIDGKSELKRSFEKLDELNDFHKFYSDVLKIVYQNFFNSLKSHIGEEIHKLMSDLISYKNKIQS